MRDAARHATTTDCPSLADLLASAQVIPTSVIPPGSMIFCNPADFPVFPRMEWQCDSAETRAFRLWYDVPIAPPKIRWVVSTVSAWPEDAASPWRSWVYHWLRCGLVVLHHACRAQEQRIGLPGRWLLNRLTGFVLTKARRWAGVWW